LVDALELSSGDTVAYVADIAGHGLFSGIFMSMLKTAVRTALRDRDCGDGAATLSQLMERLNSVLPEVKDVHLYATMAALRLNTNGERLSSAWLRARRFSIGRGWGRLSLQP
jgi:serine phosphatase RsbU (regulator of sigma subunit)